MAIVDLGLPDDDGFTLVAELTGWEIPVVVFSASDDATSVARSVVAGAKGFIGKLLHEAELVLALRAVLQGGGYFPADYSTTGDGAGPALAVLTPAERRVLLLVGEGLPTKTIATRLGSSPRTIEGHRLSMAKKLKLDALDLVTFAVTVRRALPAA